MRDAGVELLAGTDAITDFCIPGFALHDELALLVKAGLSPMEARHAATRNPARFLGLNEALKLTQHLIVVLVDPGSINY